MIVVRNSIIPIGKRFAAINLFGVLFAKRDVALTPELLNHEKIHTAQMRELLYVLFYPVYVVEWLLRMVQYKGNMYKAYCNISFEKEAYSHGNDLGYLRRRRHFSQWRGRNG